MSSTELRFSTFQILLCSDTAKTSLDSCLCCLSGAAYLWCLVSWVFRIPGVFGEKSGPYSTIFLWVGFPFGGQKQGQNTPKLVLFEFLVTRAFSGGTIKKNWRGCITAQYSLDGGDEEKAGCLRTARSLWYWGWWGWGCRKNGRES